MSERCFVIAEAGVNHNGEPDLAIRLIDAAHAVGADAVKFQTFRAGDLVTGAAETAEYQRRDAPPAQTQREMLERLELAPEVVRSLHDYGARIGIEVISTPFDAVSADLLADLGVMRFKVSSGDLTHLELLHHIAAKGRPMILSTGMAILGEIEEALDVIREAGDPPLTLLHCVSAYPAQAEDANLRAMATMAQAFGKPVGWSDHMNGNAVALAAVALGACIVEKHLTLDLDLPGPDHRTSLEPDAFAALVADIRAVERALGSGVKRPTAAEGAIARVARRSLVTACAIPSATRIELHMLAAKRPGTGIMPSRKGDIVGLYASRDLAADTPIGWEDVCGRPDRSAG